MPRQKIEFGPTGNMVSFPSNQTDPECRQPHCQCGSASSPTAGEREREREHLGVGKVREDQVQKRLFVLVVLAGFRYLDS